MNRSVYNAAGNTNDETESTTLYTTTETADEEVNAVGITIAAICSVLFIAVTIGIIVCIARRRGRTLDGQDEKITQEETEEPNKTKEFVKRHAALKPNYDAMNVTINDNDDDSDLDPLDISESDVRVNGMYANRLGRSHTLAGITMESEYDYRHYIRRSWRELSDESNDSLSDDGMNTTVNIVKPIRSASACSYKSILKNKKDSTKRAKRTKRVCIMDKGKLVTTNENVGTDSVNTSNAIIIGQKSQMSPENDKSVDKNVNDTNLHDDIDDGCHAIESTNKNGELFKLGNIYNAVSNSHIQFDDLGQTNIEMSTTTKTDDESKENKNSNIITQNGNVDYSPCISDNDITDKTHTNGTRNKLENTKNAHRNASTPNKSFTKLKRLTKSKEKSSEKTNIVEANETIVINGVSNSAFIENDENVTTSC